MENELFAEQFQQKQIIHYTEFLKLLYKYR